ncbi:hypothetical protein [Alteromonas aquimaris]|uniref:hypothetical protein n=1 Tax=Alteromonas aquimaris TaxID=2998417 RepID=UPI0022446D04|nr:hypothetical protein [Alteromonas aquimaris]
MSGSTNTTGEHHSLDYIPGSVLLGAIAAKLYAKLGDSHEQWQVFHSGKFRFGNCYPSTNAQQLSWPLPISFHFPKNSSPVMGSKLDHSVVVDMRANDAPQHIQFSQMRSGYVSSDGTVTQCEKSYQMKSAIDYSTGSVKSGQLFGYETLAKGQVFTGKISWDDDLEQTAPELVTKVLKILTDETLRVGRAKGAEFGRLSIQLAELPDSNQPNISDTFSIQCISDIALKDQFGQPCYDIRWHHLGLDEHDLLPIPEKSFVRTRQYSAYNGARQTYDQERLVIEKGSVFTFSCNNLSSEKLVSIQRKLNSGIGLFRESGLGEISLDTYPIETKQSNLIAEQSTQSEPSELINWLVKKASASAWKAILPTLAEQLVSELKKQYQTGRTLASVGNDDTWGPNTHAWAAILEQAKQIEDTPTLMNKLFSGNQPLIYVNESIQKAKAGDAWQSEVLDENGNFISIAQWFKVELTNHVEKSTVPLSPFLQRVSRIMMSEKFEYGVAQA